MKTCIAILVACAFAFAFPPGVLADWQGSVTLYIQADTLKVTTDEQGNKPVKWNRVLLTDPGTIHLNLVGTLPPGATSIEVTHTKGTGTPQSITLDMQSRAGTISTYQTNAADQDSTLTITRKRNNNDNSTVLRLLAARPTQLYGTLSAGAIYTWNIRKTYSLIGAFDASGNAIPNRSRIFEERNDNAITSTLSGKYYYLFGEQQDGVARLVQNVFSLGFFREGETRFGLFLGVAGSGDQSPSYQLGFSFFPDRTLNLAFSAGANWTQGETLTSGFKAGDIVSLANLSNVTRRRWEPGFFFSITFNPGSNGR